MYKFIENHYVTKYIKINSDFGKSMAVLTIDPNHHLSIDSTLSSLYNENHNLNNINFSIDNKQIQISKTSNGSHSYNEFVQETKNNKEALSLAKKIQNYINQNL